MLLHGGIVMEQHMLSAAKEIQPTTCEFLCKHCPQKQTQLTKKKNQHITENRYELRWQNKLAQNKTSMSCQNKNTCIIWEAADKTQFNRIVELIIPWGLESINRDFVPDNLLITWNVTTIKMRGNDIEIFFELEIAYIYPLDIVYPEH